ncbi:hypothetical protein VNO77_26955 [Canavalia gladiata]|uniref:Uncharacterized protein n=1 Tax=Canavalia gladiata TaxID=3824 RepID=A0AAN9Q615_CANGL
MRRICWLDELRNITVLRKQSPKGSSFGSAQLRVDIIEMLRKELKELRKKGLSGRRSREKTNELGMIE